MRAHMLGLVTCLLLVGLPLVALGQGTTYHWRPEGSSTSWEDEENWEDSEGNPRSDPETTDILYVDKSGGATCTYDGEDETIAELKIDKENVLVHGEDRSLTVTGYVIVGLGGASGTDWAKYELAGGTLTTGSTWVGGGRVGYFVQDGGQHTVSGDLYLGGPSGSGNYLMTGGFLSVGGTTTGQTAGNISVGHYGSGRVSQSGGSVVVNVVPDGQGGVEGGLVDVGSEGTSGNLYRISGEQSELKALAAIDIGRDREGRFEWFGGTVKTWTVQVRGKGTLAMGFDFYLEDLLDATLIDEPVPDPLKAPELLGLTDGTGALEVTNGAVCQHDCNTTLDVRALNVGSSVAVEGQEDPSGTFRITGQFTVPAVQADEVVVGKKCTAQALGELKIESDSAVVDTGSLKVYQGFVQTPSLFVGMDTAGSANLLADDLDVGDGSSVAEAKFVVTGLAEYEEGEETKYASVCLGGEGTHFSVYGAQSNCTFELTASDGSFVVKGGADGGGLIGTTVKFLTPDDGDTKKIEVMGVEEGVPSGNEFDWENFTLGGLMVGKPGAGAGEGPVTLELMDGEDNQPEETLEALYVKVLTLAPGAAFANLQGWEGTQEGRYNIYYLNDASPKRLFEGDTNLDGDVDFSDYETFETNFGTTSGATWDMGDFDGDRDVDFADYQLLEANFGQGGRGDGGGEALPETFDARPLPKLMDYDDDGDVDLDDLHILQEMMKEEDGM